MADTHRVRSPQPTRALISDFCRNGATLTTGSDFPVEGINPLLVRMLECDADLSVYINISA